MGGIERDAGRVCAHVGAAAQAAAESGGSSHFGGRVQTAAPLAARLLQRLEKLLQSIARCFSCEAPDGARLPIERDIDPLRWNKAEANLELARRIPATVDAGLETAHDLLLKGAAPPLIAQAVRAAFEAAEPLAAALRASCEAAGPLVKAGVREAARAWQIEVDQLVLTKLSSIPLEDRAGLLRHVRSDHLERLAALAPGIVGVSAIEFPEPSPVPEGADMTTAPDGPLPLEDSLTSCEGIPGAADLVNAIRAVREFMLDPSVDNANAVVTACITVPRKFVPNIVHQPLVSDAATKALLDAGHRSILPLELFGDLERRLTQALQTCVRQRAVPEI